MFTRDNLEVLRGIDDACIDLIYLDPPFNSKHDYAAPIGSEAAGAAFKDTWTLEDIDVEWIGLIADEHPDLSKLLNAVPSESDKAYLVYMSVRLLEMHRVLKPTGSIYLHCDPTMSHWLKITMDAIFGKKQFRNEITWQRHTSLAKGNQYAPKTWGSTTDTLLFYAGNDARLAPYRDMTEAERKSQFPKINEDTGERYYNDSAHIWSSPNMGARPNLCYEWRGFVNPHPSGWRLSKSRLEEEYKKGNFVIRSDGKLERRKYERDYRGKQAGNLWVDIPMPRREERVSYPTQKPLALLERIIKASSNEGDFVLDPFCGCATACVAAAKLGRKWVGIDISPKAAELVKIRAERELTDLLSSMGTRIYEIIHRTDVPKRSGKYVRPRDIKHKLYGLQEGKCECGTHFEFRHFQIDHIIPRSKGGQDTENNLQLLCSHCNVLKGNGTMEEYRSKLKDLGILAA